MAKQPHIRGVKNIFTLGTPRAVLQSFVPKVKHAHHLWLQEKYEPTCRISAIGHISLNLVTMICHARPYLQSI